MGTSIRRAPALEEPMPPKKAYKGLPLEGFLARWYARNTARVMHEFEEAARTIAAKAPEGGSVLEVAPGPGYLVIALAKLRGDLRITGLDISSTFVQMARVNATKAGVDAAFLHGDAAHMPFEAESFDFLVCRAAFKNFTEPVQALTEMYRVLKPGGQAVIIDMRNDVPPQTIDAYVKTLGLGVFNAYLTRFIFKRALIKRAYSRDTFQKLVEQTPFGDCAIREEGIGMEITLRKPTDPPDA